MQDIGTGKLLMFISQQARAVLQNDISLQITIFTLAVRPNKNIILHFYAFLVFIHLHLDRGMLGISDRNSLDMA